MNVSFEALMLNMKAAILLETLIIASEATGCPIPEGNRRD